MTFIILQGPSGELFDKNGYIAFLNNWFIFTLQTLNPMTFHISLFMVAARKLRAELITHLQSNLEFLVADI